MWLSPEEEPSAIPTILEFENRIPLDLDPQKCYLTFTAEITAI